MDNSINTYCKICNKGYHICNSCQKSEGVNSWRSVAESREHYKIYLAIHHYTVSKDAAAARAELQACDLSDAETFLPEIRSALKAIINQTH